VLEARLEPEDRPDALERPEIRVVTDDHHLGALGQGRFDGRLAQVLERLQGPAVGRATAAVA
jgi:hypothetical protein